MRPYYETSLGKAYLGDSIDVLSSMDDGSVNLALTSPPYALVFKKTYGNVDADEYIGWFLPYAREVFRTLAEDGSFVLNIGGVWNKGTPTRNLYVHKLVIALCEQVGFHLAQDLYWFNPAALPAPAEWVNVRRIRVKCSVEQVFWFSKTPWPKASNKKVLKEYSADMHRLIKNGYRAKLRPSGHNITEKFDADHGGSIPPNLLEFGNNEANSQYIKSCQRAGLPIHPARFPGRLPEFFIKLCTDEGDLVIDPFAGSNTTGEVAENLARKWVAVELKQDYLEGSRFRFLQPSLGLIGSQPRP